MKINITLIAFFASALMLTSCMKNEVSPGIESVRTAYAALLNAQATATITLANADAAYKNAQAAVQTALAALDNAEAQNRLADAEVIRAQLAADIKTWALQLQQATLTYNIAMDAYNKAVRDAKNALVTEYFTKYSNAMDTVRTVQNQIFAQQNTILGLSIDVVKGQTLTLDSLNTALANQKAALVTYQANYDAAKALLGNVPAANAKVAQLQQDSSTLENTLKTLLADMTTQSRLIDSVSYKSKVTLEATAKSNYDAAFTAAIRDTAAARFLRDTILNANLPSWWKKALDSVTNTEARLAANNADTTSHGTLYRNALALIALGTSDLDAKIASKTDSMTKYRDTLLAYIADTVTKNTARIARIADTVQVRTDTAAWWVLVGVAHDSADAQRARSVSDALAIADSAFYMAQINYAVAVRIVTTRTAWSTSVTALTNSRNTWLSQAGTRIVDPLTPVGLSDSWAGTMGVFREGIRTRLTATTGLLTTRTLDIAAAVLALPDLRSNYLYHLTFNVPLQQAVVLAKAYKESKRADYETWRDTYYTNTYLVGLDAAVTSKLGLWNTAKQNTIDAKALLELQPANIELVRLNALKKTGDASLATVKALIPLWKAVVIGQGDYLQPFLNLVTTATNTTIPGTELNIKLAKQAYLDKKVLYDQYTIILTSLQTELTSANANAAFWKKLLDAAIAAG